MALARVNAVGYVGTQPELVRVGAKKTAKTRFRLALQGYRGGEKHTDWQTVVVWGKQAEVCERFLGPGHLVAVTGRLESRSYEVDGHRRWVTEIVADNVDFFGPSRRRSEEENRPVVADREVAVPF